MVKSQPNVLVPDSHALLAAIVSSTDDAIVSKDLNSIVTSWNWAAEKLFGFTAEEMIGESILRLIPPEIRGEEDQIIAKIKAGERVEHFETTRLHKSGRRIHASITVSPIRNPAGEIIGASNIARDIGEQREADRAKALLAAVVRSSDDAIISKNTDGIVMSWNSAAERLYGYPANEMIGSSIRKLIPSDLQWEEDQILAKIRRNEKIEHYETTRLHKSGRKLEVSVTISPIHDSHGRVIGASKIARDITAKRDEERQKDQFLAILAHELRNPLAPITSALALMATPQVAEERRMQALTIATRQAAQMARLLDDLLDVARITTGHVELKPSEFDMRSAVRGAVDAVRTQMEAKTQTLECDLPADAVPLYADETRVFQVVSNLLVNAVKYTHRNGRVWIRLARIADYAELRVRDDGVGMSTATLASLFTLFARGEHAESRSAGGLGIGLALVREFAERHGGTVSASSEGPGRGSEFVLRLPLQRRI